MTIVPVVLFTYRRADLLRVTLACLRENQVPLIYAFSDGPDGPGVRDDVAEVRTILRATDWCDLRLVERPENLGLGRSILTGVAEVLSQHEAVIVFEDDLICVPGTYNYLATALEHYKHDSRVMSVTGWTHSRITPSDVGNLPYFDGRAECWVWGTWRRAWNGMDRPAMSLVRSCRMRGIDVYRYGADLVDMARSEIRQNIWAVRWLYLHILKRALCLRPPWNMVEHIGNDNRATNAAAWNEGPWANPPLQSCPKTPASWPEPAEHQDCPGLWQEACGRKPPLRALIQARLNTTATSISRLPGGLRRRWLGSGS